jgi:galactokinase
MPNIPDSSDFQQTLQALSRHRFTSVRDFFKPGAEIIVTRAPGRLDVMGGIADYSGSLVLQLPLNEAAWAALQPVSERTITVVSLDTDRDEADSTFSLPLDDFGSAAAPIEYAQAQRYFQEHPQHHWAAYMAGAFLVLMREKGVHFERGARILLHSVVPEGKGVSSSAAIEVATMAAVAAAFNVELSGRELAILCQKVENLVVGAPCGVMDQMTAACGQKNRLLALLCQPAEIQGMVAIPPELAVWGIDSGIRHAVSGADYGSVRVGAFMGYKILQQHAGEDWGGYLANLTPSLYEQHYRHLLPEQLAGDEFLRRYGELPDTVTTVDPDQTYAVRQPTAHPIYEHFRVRTFARLLAGDPLTNAPLLGELMYQSHAGYSACGLGSGGTDRLVALARAVGHAAGIYGAKITGGGSGGTVAILSRADAGDAVQQIAATYAEESGHQPVIFAGSSAGAAEFGHRRVV